eukprot:12916252-Prorocentrum_lima.AAC.1
MALSRFTAAQGTIVAAAHWMGLGRPSKPLANAWHSLRSFGQLPGMHHRCHACDRCPREGTSGCSHIGADEALD